ncbi:MULTISPECIES: hypothetical protein [Amycolatopsis]|uniref:hypothetical protein n=1 Tax=Amycolatopsis TaxID=1813 RepID=UPI00056AABA8|nr:MULTISPECIES: hypothetical protein [Amycolatopsis]MCG3750895.1 hypothetical protein [Amycolatopsis sp. Poz14]
MANVDPSVFAGLAPEFLADRKLLADVANWADLCTAPRGAPVQHPESGINNHVLDDSRQWPDRSKIMQDNRPANLPMPDTTINHFFYHARVLSQPQLDKFEDPHRLLGDLLVNLTVNLTNQPGDVHDPQSPARQASGGQMGLHDALDHLFDNWSGAAKDKCLDYAGSIYDFLQHEQVIVAEAADALLAYCSVLVGARKKLVNLMRGFVSAMQKREAEDVSEDQAFPWGIVAAAVVAVASGGFGLAALPAAAATAEIVNAVAQPVLGLAGNVADKMLSSGGTNSVTSADYEAAARQYFHDADAIIEDVRKGITQIAQSYGDMESRYLPPPAPPLTKAEFDANHRELEPEAR